MSSTSCPHIGTEILYLSKPYCLFLVNILPRSNVSSIDKDKGTPGNCFILLMNFITISTDDLLLINYARKTKRHWYNINAVLKLFVIILIYMQIQLPMWIILKNICKCILTQFIRMDHFLIIKRSYFQILLLM